MPHNSGPQSSASYSPAPQRRGSHSPRPQPARAAAEEDSPRPAAVEARAHRPAPLRGTSLSFNIGLFNLLWRGIVLGIGVQLILPAPWVAVWFWRWTISRIVVPGHRTLGFIGQPGDIWYVFMSFGALNYVRWIGLIFNNMTLTLAFAIAGVLLQFVLAWIMLRWVVSNLVASYERLAISFTGGPIAMVGWLLLLLLPILTIVGSVWAAASLSDGSLSMVDWGWLLLLLASMLIIISWTAWVVVWMIRWVCRNLEGTRRDVIFIATGPQVLWRSLIFAFSCAFLIPIPAMLRWYARWFISQFYLVSREEQATA
ncbi:MAG: hypothetical protein FWD68_14995 [Alphaproteobacteria bacterium]|nr:hypothetical protein [Alphaproteobacteria bacterium]